jgi:hypothetical protein
MSTDFQNPRASARGAVNIPSASSAWCLLAALLTGCATAAPEPIIDVRTVNIAIPVPCREAIPDRPAMPTEALIHRPTLDEFIAAAIAEIELREGYEGQLRAALVACTAPAGQ